jgi:hypothetical protein
MSEKELIEALKEKLLEKGDDFRFIHGREVLTAKAMIEKIDHDKKFRKTIVQMIHALSMDLILREKP